MSIIPDAEWKPRLGALADQFAAKGVLHDAAWRDAFTTVPRHLFVPGFYASTWPPRWAGAAAPEWLSGVYSDKTLPTQLLPLRGQPENHYVTSSSTRPGYMLWLLHLLDAADGMNVLEIGTGTGYNAALLCERLGDEHVTSIDIDPELIELARERLAQAGYCPLLSARDGAVGHTARAPYDRIITTVALPRVPYTWVEQTRPGGMILADLRPPGMIRAGALAKLTVEADGTAHGRLIDGGVGFMSARDDAAAPASPNVPVIDKRTVHERDSRLSGDVIDAPGLAFAIWQRLPGIAVFPRPDRIMATTPDGSWTEVTRASPAHVEYGGPTDLWEVIEQVARVWQAHGDPGIDAYEIGVTVDGQSISLGPPSTPQ